MGCGDRQKFIQPYSMNPPQARASTVRVKRFLRERDDRPNIPRHAVIFLPSNQLEKLEAVAEVVAPH
jgi:hypothetical protein